MKAGTKEGREEGREGEGKRERQRQTKSALIKRTLIFKELENDYL